MPQVDAQQKMTTARREAIREIKRNIAANGFHIYLVAAGHSPRFCYTIGVKDTLGYEFVFAGGVYYSAADVVRIVKRCVRSPKVTSLDFGALGRFSLQKIHNSWASKLLLGANDFYGVSHVPAVQIVPPRKWMTIDVPNLSLPWSAKTEPVWRWLNNSRTCRVTDKAMAGTNLAALRGDRVTEVARWETDYWELFAGPGPKVKKRDYRVVPLAMLLAADPSLSKAVGLEIGSGLWRDKADVGWHEWRVKSSGSRTVEVAQNDN
jgi:hypothetical protein